MPKLKQTYLLVATKTLAEKQYVLDALQSAFPDAVIPMGNPDFQTHIQPKGAKKSQPYFAQFIAAKMREEGTEDKTLEILTSALIKRNIRTFGVKQEIQLGLASNNDALICAPR